MKFDTAVAAQEAFRRVQEAGELGEDLDEAMEAQAQFDESAGEASSEAYQRLTQIGERHPKALAYQEFLIYSTWNYVLEGPSPDRFKKGLDLCDRYLKTAGGKAAPATMARIRELRRSFQNGLGLERDEEIEEYEEDAFQGGD